MYALKALVVYCLTFIGLATLCYLVTKYGQDMYPCLEWEQIFQIMVFGAGAHTLASSATSIFLKKNLG